MDGIKNDSEKSRVDLIPPEVLLSVGDVLRFGEKKYSADNWKKVENGMDRYYAATLRHLFAWKSGEILDSESGLSHLAHAVTSLIFLLWHSENRIK